MLGLWLNHDIKRGPIHLHSLSGTTASPVQCWSHPTNSLQWRHNEHARVSNHQPHDCLLNRLFRHRWKKTSKLRVTGLCAGNSPVTSEFPAKEPVTRKMFPFDDVIMSPAPDCRYALFLLWYHPGHIHEISIMTSNYKPCDEINVHAITIVKVWGQSYTRRFANHKQNYKNRTVMLEMFFHLG